MTGISRQKHAFLVAGTHSGCGKTTITLGLLAAFKARGLRIQPFKVGPDFIDPGLHTKIAGTESRNLDGWMLDREWNTGLFQRLLSKADIGLVEGVMGLFDGYEGGAESGSSAEMAKWLDVPAVLVVDARSMARSAAALLYGFTHFDPALKISGVIFNRVGGEAHLAFLKEAVESALPGLPILGGIPRDDEVRIPERHLGLVTADEMGMDQNWRDRLAGLMERHLDLNMLLEKTEYPGPLTADSLISGLPRVDTKPLIAVARDAAYCFYYPDNLELLEQAGARLHFFSPVAGESFPTECAGLYLGGGYPELFAGRISANLPFLEFVRERAAQGMPVYAECGGLMTLGRFIDTVEGERFPMARIFPFGTRMLRRRKALGYTEVLLRRKCLLGSPGAVIRGHEFHYSEIVPPEEDCVPQFAYELHKRKYEGTRREGYMAGSVLAGYIHLHWGSNPNAAYSFVRQCAGWMEQR